MNYNKKQMQPLISKYGINAETNKLFAKVCEMFEGQSNYQLWGVKMIFSQTMTFEELEHVHKWIEATNGNLINKLEKKNIVSYSNTTNVAKLLKEIEGIERVSLIKYIISHFNTQQRNMLTDSILGKEMTPLEAYESKGIEKWYNVLKTFNKKPMGIKNKFYSTCSAFRSIEALHKAILDCLEESYDWDEGKEDLLAFIEHNAKDCEVVFNEGNCVIVRVPSFESSHKLCGNGRTGWCLSREESFFKNYVTSTSNRSQYFLFDFNRKETDAFAHIGFTIEGGSGIVEAQTGHNFPMLHRKFEQGKEKLDIRDVFKKLGVTTKTFLRLPKDMGFDWNIKYFLDLVKGRPESFAIAYQNDNRLVVNFLNFQAFRDVISKTFINPNQYSSDPNHKLYLVLDFNLPIDNDKSIIAIQYLKDRYGDMSLYKISDIFGADLGNEGYLSEIGLKVDDFLNREAIDPSILLHKFIDEGKEDEAIKLIENERENINVNFEFNQKVPIFQAMNKKMFKLFDVIVNHKGFDSKMDLGRHYLERSYISLEMMKL